MFKTLTSKRVSLLVFIVALLATGSIFGQQGTGSGSGAGAGSGSGSSRSDATTVFRSARDLITDGNWSKAQEKFDEYVTSFPDEKNIDAALYWLAYTQHKLAKYDQCRATIDRLLEKYPNTTWKEDARVLLAQVPIASTAAFDDMITTVRAIAATAPMAVQEPSVYTPAVPVPEITVAPAPGAPIQGVIAASGFGYDPDIATGDDDDDPCEFKIVVLQALFQSDLQRGIMVATEWLKSGSTQTVRCKSAALTLLGRNGGKAVTPVILGVARSEPDLKLRARAISTLGATNDDSVIDALRDFALNAREDEIVEASLYALSRHTGERAITVLSEFASNGSRTTAQRKVAIASIASRPGEPAVDALFRIYDADPNIEIRKAVISGFGNRKSERAGNRLFEIARGSDNVELRKAAISGIARRGGDKAIEFLLSLYDTEKNEELKDQIVNSLGYGTGIFAGTALAIPPPGQTTIGYGGGSRMSDQRVIRKLIEIARNPQAPMERRKRAIGWLSMSKDPEVLKFLEELLK
ncbi:MAG TPA: HEAT repeat domain-containing protein [Pyrinomonadaceae bacterium]